MARERKTIAFQSANFCWVRAIGEWGVKIWEGKPHYLDGAGSNSVAQGFFDVIFNRFRCVLGSIPLDRVTLTIHEKLCEIPFDTFGSQ